MMQRKIFRAPHLEETRCRTIEFEPLGAPAFGQQILGHGVAARLSARLGEGVVNGMLTARVGIAAIEVCRPLPYLNGAPPRLADVLAMLRPGSEKELAG